MEYIKFKLLFDILVLPINLMWQYQTMFFLSQNMHPYLHSTKISYSHHRYMWRKEKINRHLNILIVNIYRGAQRSRTESPCLLLALATALGRAYVWSPREMASFPSTLLRTPCCSGPRLTTWGAPRPRGSFHLSFFWLSGSWTVRLFSLENADQTITIMTDLLCTQDA